MQKISFVNKLICVLASVFICTSIFASLQKTLSDWGIFLAFIINSSAAFLLIKRYAKSSWQRLIGLSIVWTMVLMLLMLIIGLTLVSHLIDKAL